MTDVRGVLSYDDWKDGTSVPGKFKFFSEPGIVPAGIHFECPCGCKRTDIVGFAGGKALPTVGWDRDWIEPTIGSTISVECGWSGTLTAGIWRRGDGH